MSSAGDAWPYDGVRARGVVHPSCLFHRPAEERHDAGADGDRSEEPGEKEVAAEEREAGGGVSEEREAGDRSEHASVIGTGARELE